MGAACPSMGAPPPSFFNKLGVILGSSSSSIPWECQSDSYNILNDTNRKSNNNDSMHDEFCDKSSHSFASPDWKGESWYRIMPPAGTQLADSLGPDHLQVKCS